MMPLAQQQVSDLLDFIDASPSPWHAVATLQQRLVAQGFQILSETHAWNLQPGGRYCVVRDDASIIAFIVGQQAVADVGFKIVGAHTDSPGLRVKPNPLQTADGWLRLGVEIYGGPILATFTDRDLSLAGRVSYRQADGLIATGLVHFPQALLRLPNLAIHMNRGVNEDGLKLHKQNELPLLLRLQLQERLPDDYFKQLLCEQLGTTPEAILAWELQVYDTQKGSFWGVAQEFYSDSQLDNLASCHAGLTALLQQHDTRADATLVLACFDHEEVGSASSKGAESSFLADILERIALAQTAGREDFMRALARSFMVSADMAHAYHPNFPGAYETEHKVLVNQGPVIKLNANQRYASESISSALFAQWCALAEIPYQTYVHRTDLGCGSTIGPIIATQLGVRTVDVGCPMWAMHSCRESAGVLDHAYMIKALSSFWQQTLMLNAAASFSSGY